LFELNLGKYAKKVSEVFSNGCSNCLPPIKHSKGTNSHQVSNDSDGPVYEPDSTVVDWISEGEACQENQSEVLNDSGVLILELDIERNLTVSADTLSLSPDISDYNGLPEFTTSSVLLKWLEVSKSQVGEMMVKA
jgi:hypothetical protein